MRSDYRRYWNRATAGDRDAGRRPLLAYKAIRAKIQSEPVREPSNRTTPEVSSQLTLRWRERDSTAEETARVKALLREAVDAGAFGFSTTVLNQHMGYQARPHPR
jgi:hypothetical protein